MKIDVDQGTVDKLIKKRVTAFNKEIRDLKAKLERRDKRIQKLVHEVEVLKSVRMDEEKVTAERIAKIARCLVGEMQRANWVEKYEGCGVEWEADEYDR
jgi:predicted RNase H-like nuclease (RuvC/YqgF family)